MRGYSDEDNRGADDYGILWSGKKFYEIMILLDKGKI